MRTQLPRGPGRADPGTVTLPRSGEAWDGAPIRVRRALDGESVCPGPDPALPLPQASHPPWLLPLPSIHWRGREAALHAPSRSSWS